MGRVSIGSSWRALRHSVIPRIDAARIRGRGLRHRGAGLREWRGRRTATAALVTGTTRPRASTRRDSARTTKKKHKSRKHKAHKHDSVRSNVWAQRTLTYYETIPSQWDWSLSTAVAKWNASGARSASCAWRPSAGPAGDLLRQRGVQGGGGHVGPTVHPWVRLSTYYRNVDANDASNRVEVMAVLAHELGHVLGFEHTDDALQPDVAGPRRRWAAAW